MENHHFQWVNPLYMAMFNSYFDITRGYFAELSTLPYVCRIVQCHLWGVPMKIPKRWCFDPYKTWVANSSPVSLVSWERPKKSDWNKGFFFFTAEVVTVIRICSQPVLQGEKSASSENTTLHSSCSLVHATQQQAAHNPVGVLSDVEKCLSLWCSASREGVVWQSTGFISPASKIQTQTSAIKKWEWILQIYAKLYAQLKSSIFLSGTQRRHVFSMGDPSKVAISNGKMRIHQWI